MLALLRTCKVLSCDAKNGVQAALEKTLKQPELPLVENPGLCTIQEGGNSDISVYLDLHLEAE